MGHGSPADQQNKPTVLQQALVDQLNSYGFTLPPSIEAAFRAVPRHLFLPGLPFDQVYRNEAIVTKWEGEKAVSSSSQPTAMAAMLMQLGLEPGHRVLEIGAGTGFNSALMAHIAGVTGKVTSIDIDEDICEAARENLAKAGIAGIEVIRGDGGYGYAPSAPYDRIMVTVGSADITPSWREQLKPDGRIVLPLAIMPDGHQMTFGFEFSDNDDALTSVSVTTCAFMPLRGAFPGMQPKEDRKLQLGPEPDLLLHLNSLAEYLIERIRDWDAAGRHPDMRRLKIRAYPRESHYTPAAAEIVIDRPCTRFVLGK